MVMKFSRDHFFYKAKENGHLARSYYKLQEADQKFKLLKPGMRVLDLGCSPGSWIEYCLERVGTSGYIIGIDRTALHRNFPGVDIILDDIRNIDPKRLLENNQPFDIVLSDLAPDTTGTPSVDSYRSYELSLIAFTIAKRVLKNDGVFFCKIFQGEDFKQFLNQVKKCFSLLNVFKPKASKKASREVYIVALGKLHNMGP
jgi:23S rRNA (uridine2552-2'-O)-methyltransferase